MTVQRLINALQEIKAVRTVPFVFFLDGVDELGAKLELFVVCELHAWTRSTFVFGSRTGHLQVSLAERAQRK